MSEPDRDALLRRLLGAGVLFGGLFLFSLLLPDGGDSEVATGEQASTQSVRIDLNPQPAPVPSGAPAPASPPTETPAAVSESSRAAADPEPGQPAPLTEDPEPVVQPKPAPKPVREPESTPQVDKRAPASAPVASGWWVQVASFGDAGNAQRLVENLKESALPARRESVAIGQRTLHRVLVGPYADKAEADAARGRVILLGFADSRSLQR